MECLRDNFYEGFVLDGRFQAISPLNHGSFGMVFMAKDLISDEIVAIKCLTKKSAVEESALSFVVDEKSEELSCHTRLGSHPNIVNLIHSFETDAHIYLVLEFCSRGDLYEAIRTGCGPLETEHVRAFMLQLVDAVAYIHSKGMYHRDIKPENIFLTHDGNMKLGDFGLATQDSWSYETTVGSDRYMAPEQYDSAGAGYSPAQADIWAIGICLLNILFSRNPFTRPTESDPLFLDFSRDKQSLFDVFPTMSQDTFEVITHCMNLDPRKRSLSGVRLALLRVVTFTTFDESLDDFCTAARPPIASANREPLRTPSIQSPPAIEHTSFPWAKALHATLPQPIRELSTISVTASYTEELFPKSEESNNDWFSVGPQTPSMASMLESSLGASVSSLAVKRQSNIFPPRTDAAPVSGSLPIAMAKPKMTPSMSSVFGRKNNMVSKSWSDLWDEDIEEEHENDIQQRQAQNARTWSHESSNNVTSTIRREGLSEPKSSSFVNMKSMSPETGRAGVGDIDNDMVNDGFFFHDTTPRRHYSPPRYSPPSKRTTFDKWAALGDRRRAYAGVSNAEKSTDAWKGRRNLVNVQASQDLEQQVGISKDKAHNNYHHTNRAKECPWARDRDCHQRHQNQRGSKGRSSDLGDLEWVGGWHDVPGLQL